MARRRRDKGSPAEIIAGLVIFFVGMPMISPRVRAMYVNAFASILKALKAKNEPVLEPVRRSPLSHAADGYAGGPNFDLETTSNLTLYALIPRLQ